MISARRQAAALVFGLVYGGGVVNGIHKGLTYALRVDEGTLVDSPILSVAVEISSVIAMSFLTGYVSRRMLIGTLAAALGSALILAMPALFSVADSTPSLRQVGAALAFALAVPAGFCGSRYPVEAEDLATGRVLGVSWRHWLWLWLPWQYMIANAVWLATPRFLILGTGGWALGDLLRSAVAAGVASVGAWKAVEALREDAGLTRIQALLRFLGWFLLVPILANLWRMLLLSNREDR